MLIFRFKMLFWVAARLVLYELMPKTLCFSSCLFNALLSEYQVCSDWSARTRLSRPSNNNRASVLNQFLSAELATWNTLCKCVAW